MPVERPLRVEIFSRSMLSTQNGEQRVQPGDANAVSSCRLGRLFPSPFGRVQQCEVVRGEAFHDPPNRLSVPASFIRPSFLSIH